MSCWNINFRISIGIALVVGGLFGFIEKEFFSAFIYFLSTFVTSFLFVQYFLSPPFQKKITQLEQELLEVQESKKNQIESNLLDFRQKLKAQEKLASLGFLTVGVVHEIKSPLNFINNYAEVCIELLQENQSLLESQKEKIPPAEWTEIQENFTDANHTIRMIFEQGQRIETIVRNMLLHARDRKSEMQLFDLNQLLKDNVNLSYHGMKTQYPCNVEIQFQLDEAIGNIQLFPQELGRVFLNLLNNAFYAIYQKEKKESLDSLSSLSIVTLNLGEKVEIRIRDSGGGISQKVLGQIFQPFFTTKPAGEGTGLGLSLSYEIITQYHRGEIVVNSEVGQYTEFVIFLPRKIPVS